MENNEEKEQSIEEIGKIAATIFKEKYKLLPTERSEGFKTGYSNGFYDGANHILSSKGLVEREAVVKAVEDRIAILHAFSLRDNIQYETADKMRFAKGELTDLITKINQL